MSRKLFKIFYYPFSLMSFFWKQSKKHCKEILIHRSNNALLGGTRLSSGQALHSCPLCGNTCQKRTGTPGQFITSGHSLVHNRGCAALLSLAISFIWTLCQCVAPQGLLREGAGSLSQGLLTQLPLRPCSCEKGNDAQGARGGAHKIHVIHIS